jgi:hypothetical protein
MILNEPNFITPSCLYSFSEGVSTRIGFSGPVDGDGVDSLRFIWFAYSSKLKDEKAGGKLLRGSFFFAGAALTGVSRRVATPGVSVVDLRRIGM